MHGLGGFDIEIMREMLRDDRLVLDIGVIDSVEVAIDGSVIRCKVRMIPDNDIIIARMSWGNIGSGGGSFMKPQPADLVLVGFADKEEDSGFIIARLSSKDDLIPFLRVVLGDNFVHAAKPGQELHLISDTAIRIDRGGLLAGSEPLVLGTVLSDALEGIYDKQIDSLDKIITGPIGIGNMGQDVPTHPGLIISLTTIKTALELDKLVFITTVVTNIVSQIAFTER